MKSYNLLYKPVSIDAGAQSDTLFETDLNSITSMTQPLTLTVKYRSENLGCLSDRQFTGSYTLNLVEVLKPVKMEQTYAMDVSGSCNNRYYSCSDGSKGTVYNIGYRCYNRNPYYDDSIGRLLFEYEMPQPSANMNPAAAFISLHVLEVSGMQGLSIYGTDTKWDTVNCIAGGDICTEPYCPECMSIHNLGNSVISSAQVNGPGQISLDISDAVKKYAPGETFSIQARVSDEDKWKKHSKVHAMK